MAKSKMFWIRLAVSAIALGLVFGTLQGRLHEVLAILGRVSWRHLTLAVLLFFLSMILLVFRLRELLRVQAVSMSFSNLFSLSMIGLFFNNFMPSAVGGDVVKVYYVAKQTGKTMEPLTSVLIDRLVGCLAFIGWSAVAFLMYKGRLDEPVIAHSVYLMVTLAVVLVVLFGLPQASKLFYALVARLPWPQWRERLERLYGGVRSYGRHPGVLAITFLYSIGAQFFLIVMNWVLARSMGFQVSLGFLMLIIPIIGVVQMAPSINGLGVREGAYVFFLGPEITHEGALALSLLFYATFLAISLSGGLLYLLRGGALFKPIPEVDV